MKCQAFVDFSALLAIRFWMVQDHTRFIRYSAFAIIVFRSELCLLFGIMLLMDLVSGRISISKLLQTAIPAGLFSLGTKFTETATKIILYCYF